MAALLAAACSSGPAPPTQAGGPRASSTSTFTPGSTPVAAPGAGPGWSTYHGDLLRSGVGPATGFATLRAAWTSVALDGEVYAEPLYVGGRVVAATTNDTVYGLDPATGTVTWRDHLGTPATSADLPCGDVSPLGILSTPAGDPATGRVYVVAEVRDGEVISHRLVALDAATGNVVFSEPVDPPGSVPAAQQQRSALTVSAGRVYIAFGGLYGDCGQYHGYVVSVSAAAAGPLAVYQVPTTREGAVWSPAGPVVDASGNVWVATGNGVSTTAYDHGNSVLELSPGLTLQASYAPSDWAVDNSADRDLGSTSPVLLPGGLVFQVGKQATGLVFREGDGGVGSATATGAVCFVIGSEAFAGHDVYVPCRDGMVDVHIDSASAFHVMWRAAAGVTGSPVLAGGRLWDAAGSSLYGLDPATGRVEATIALAGRPAPYSTPSFAPGLLLIGVGGAVEALSAG